jgi:hypothetical protein
MYEARGWHGATSIGFEERPGAAPIPRPQKKQGQGPATGRDARKAEKGQEASTSGVVPVVHIVEGKVGHRCLAFFKASNNAGATGLLNA